MYYSLTSSKVIFQFTICSCSRSMQAKFLPPEISQFRNRFGREDQELFGHTPDQLDQELHSPIGSE